MSPGAFFPAAPSCVLTQCVSKSGACSPPKVPGAPGARERCFAPGQRGIGGPCGTLAAGRPAPGAGEAPGRRGAGQSTQAPGDPSLSLPAICRVFEPTHHLLYSSWNTWNPGGPFSCPGSSGISHSFRGSVGSLSWNRPGPRKRRAPLPLEKKKRSLFACAGGGARGEARATSAGGAGGAPRAAAGPDARPPARGAGGDPAGPVRPGGGGAPGRGPPPPPPPRGTRPRCSARGEEEEEGGAGAAGGPGAAAGGGHHAHAAQCHEERLRQRRRERGPEGQPGRHLPRRLGRLRGCLHQHPAAFAGGPGGRRQRRRRRQAAAGAGRHHGRQPGQEPPVAAPGGDERAWPPTRGRPPPRGQWQTGCGPGGKRSLPAGPRRPGRREGGGRRRGADAGGS